MNQKNRESQIQADAKNCRHFNGIQNGTCKAGVSYDSLPKGTNILKYACFGFDTARCKKFEATGVDAARKKWEEIDKHTVGFVEARTAITNKEGKNRGVQGRIDCPVCGQKESLHYSIAGYNGHIHAACKTEGCVRWME